MTDRSSIRLGIGCHVYACVDMLDSVGTTCSHKRKHGTQANRQCSGFVHWTRQQVV
jgi:hypothetical protein